MNEEIPYRTPEMLEYWRDGARKNSALLRKMSGQPTTPEAAKPKHVGSSAGLDDALVILKNISKEYSRFCDVMMTMPEHPEELKSGSRFMDSLEALRDELIKRKTTHTTIYEANNGED